MTFDGHVLTHLPQSLTPPPRSHGDEEEEDLNKVFDVQCFPQIFGPAAFSPPDKYRVYDEQDFEGETLKLKNEVLRFFIWVLSSLGACRVFQEVLVVLEDVLKAL